MLHEFVGQLISLHTVFLSDGATSTSDNFKTAIVTTAGVVVSAALAAFAVIYQKHRETNISPPARTSLEDEPLVKELRRQLREAHENARRHSVIERNYVTTIQRLEGYLWDSGINPNTGRRHNDGSGENNNATAPA